MLKKLGKFLLVLLAIVVLALACWGLAVYFEWPVWGAAALFFGVIAAVLAAGFVRRVFYLSKERILRRAATRKAEAAAPVDPVKELRSRWRAGLALLRESGLRRLGDPVHALPWFLMLGPNGSGKSAALARSRAVSAIKQVDPAASITPTPNCDWWYFDGAVVIDTAGRYSEAGEGSPARREWTELLKLLSATRRKEPLNGVVLTVAADSLRSLDPDALASQGRHLRARIDELMRVFDARFPVYVLVTKCDLLFGIDAWTRHLPEATLDQPMGYLAPEGEAQLGEFLDSAFDSIGERLKDLRLITTRGKSELDPAHMLFPEEFETLKPGLATFLQAAFEVSSYLETPHLRGLFFGSGQQQGAMSSAVLPAGSFSEQTMVLPGTLRGLFLKALFARILPGERHLVRPLGYITQWQRITRNVGLSAWLLAALAVSLVLTLSFRSTFDTLNELHQKYPGAPTLSGSFGKDLQAMTAYHDIIQWMDERDRDPLVRLIPFNDNVVQLEEQLKQRYAKDFQKFLLAALDSQIALRVKALADGNAGAENIAVRYIQFIVRRLNLVQARLDGMGSRALSDMPPPSRSGLTVVEITRDLDPGGVSSEAAKAFSILYVAYLSWQQDESSLHLERDALLGWIRQLALSDEKLEWLVDWANEQTFLKPVALSEFWLRGAPEGQGGEVAAAYTLKAQETIFKFLKEVEQSTGGTQDYQLKRAAFDTWYREQRLKAWLGFLQNFGVGKAALRGEPDWRRLMETMTGAGSPYYSVIRRVVNEFEGTTGEVPPWLELARQLNSLRPPAGKSGLLDSASRAAAIANAAGKRVIQGTVDSGPEGGKAVIDAQLSASKAYEAYHAELDKVWPEALLGEGKARKIAADFHGYNIDPAVKESPLHAARAAYEGLRKAVGKGDFDSQAVWSLVAAPMDFMIEYVTQQSACTLQQEWASKVVYPSKGAPSSAELGDLLYGAKGVVWDYADNTARPFLHRTASAYVPTETLGYRVPFDNLFLHFVNSALARKAQLGLDAEQAKLAAERDKANGDKRRQRLEKRKQDVQKKVQDAEQQLTETRQAIDKLKGQAVTVTIRAKPTSVNPEATAYPHATLLSVECAPTARSLANYNFPVSETFDWSQKTCGDVALQVKVESLSLARKYAGPQGLARFLEEFRDGARVFTPADFPAQAARLKELGIGEIRLHYEFDGQDTVLRQADELKNLERREAKALQAKQRYKADQEMIEDDLAELEREEIAEREAGKADKQEEVGGYQDTLRTKGTFDLRIPPTAAACWEVALAPRPAAKPLASPPVAVAAPAEPPAQGAATAPPSTKAAKGRQYMVQVGLFPEENAARIRKILEREGMAVHESTIESYTGAIWHRLRVGPYLGRDEADQALEKVREKTKLKGLVIRSKPADVR